MTAATASARQLPVADPARIARRNSAIRRRFVQELPPSHASVMIVIAELCNYGNNPLGCFAKARTIASKVKSSRSSRTGKPIAERHLRRITADLVMGEWLEVEHHVHRDPRYRYRTYRLGRKALVFEMHVPTEPLGAGGHSGLAELVGAGGHSGQGAGGPGRPSDSGTAPKGALSVEETTTKSEPDPESSSSFLVSLDLEEPQIPEAPVVQIPEASLAEIPEPEAVTIPEPTSTPAAVETPAADPRGVSPAIPAAEASLVIRLLAVLVITRTLAAAKIREWVRVHGLEKVHLVLTLAEHRKSTRNPFRCEGGIGWVLTRWRNANMPLEAIREEVAAHEPPSARSAPVRTPAEKYLGDFHSLGWAPVPKPDGTWTCRKLVPTARPWSEAAEVFAMITGAYADEVRALLAQRAGGEA